MSNSILAPALKPGETIALISPSARLNSLIPKSISRGSELLSSFGYKVRVVFTEDNGIQSCIKNRLSEIEAVFTDPEISAIVCTIGGDTVNEILPSLIANKALQAHIREHPKIFVGYSDITGLHWFLNTMTGLRTFYGPSIIAELGTCDDPQNSPRAFCAQHLIDIITKTTPVGPAPRSEYYAPGKPSYFGNPNSTAVQETVPTMPWQWLRRGTGQGRLFGGVLGGITRCNGVRPIAPDWAGRIVFVETSFEMVNKLDLVRRGVGDLIAQGVFNQAAGLVIGRPVGFDSGDGYQAYIKVFTELLLEGDMAKHSFPILFNVDFGHTTPMFTLPYNAMASLDSETDTFSILEPGVL